MKAISLTLIACPSTWKTNSRIKLSIFILNSGSISHLEELEELGFFGGAAAEKTTATIFTTTSSAFMHTRFVMLSARTANRTVISRDLSCRSGKQSISVSVARDRAVFARLRGVYPEIAKGYS